MERIVAKDKKDLLIKVGYHARIMINALMRMLLSTLTIVLFVIAIAGFCLVAKEGGYAAVFDFIWSCVTFAIAVVSMYFLGNPRKFRGGRYVEEQ